MGIEEEAEFREFLKWKDARQQAAKSPTSGVKTSEYKVTMIDKIGGYLLAVGILIAVAVRAMSIEQVTALVPILVAVVAGSAVGTGAYSWSRGFDKASKNKNGNGNGG